MARKTRLPGLDSEVGKTLFQVLYRSPFEVVAEWIEALDDLARKALLKDCDALLADVSEIDDESRRVGIAKLLVALLPTSRESIERELSRVDGAHAEQFHFALFSMLEQLRRHGAGMLDIPRLTGNYLRAAKSEGGHAVWMAGELLGEHADLAEALEVLLDLTQTARSINGRLGALHGLGHALPRASASQRATIERALRKVMTGARSKRVSQYAKSVLATRALGKKTTANSARSRKST